MRDGCELICVTLNDPDDWRDHMALFDYGFSKVEQVKLTPKQRDISLTTADGRQVKCNVPEMVMTMTRDGASRAESRVYLPEFIYAPLCKGDKVGKIVYLLDGRELGRRDITASEDIVIPTAEQNYFIVIFRKIRQFTGL
jgi:D-alanyl-D-alanine carboxypeptidase/D-alanyl-D-alanine carboxypeptidase (penicillin-binding protein 5/6)